VQTVILTKKAKKAKMLKKIESSFTFGTFKLFLAFKKNYIPCNIKNIKTDELGIYTVFPRIVYSLE
jgi:hypothetical protein